MRHTMHLRPQPFSMLRSGEKTIELRLNDEKRQQIAVGDEIEFCCPESGHPPCTVHVKALHRFPNFTDLYAALPLLKCGYTRQTLASASPEDMNVYYSPQEQAQYGVVGIEVKLPEQEDTLRQKRLFLLDMDGTIYLDETLFEGTLELLRHIKDIGGRYLFLTNNSSKSVEAYVDKLARLGIEAAAGDFLTSTNALILDLKSRGLTNRLHYAFGTASFRQQLRDAGIRITDRREKGIEALLCGFDTELSFQKLEDACILLNEGVDFIATNPDWVCPTWYGSVPDCGSVCEMLFRATGRRPRVIGKPQPAMALLAMESAGFSPAQTVLIGDRVYTDIACGYYAGVDTILVLSGEGTRADAESSNTPPTWILEDVQQLYHILTEGSQ